MSEFMDNSDNNIEVNLDDSDDIVTMVDVLNEQEKLEKEYFAALDAAEEKCSTYSSDYIDKDASDKLPENQTDDDKQINEQNTDGAAKNSGGDDTGDNKPVDELLKDEINQCIADIIEINKHISDSNDESSDDVEQPPSKRQKINAAATETTTKQNIPHESLYDAGMRELSRMDHVQKVEVIMGYNKMKEKLTQFLNAFVTNNQVVTEEDINRFFRMLKDKKDDGNDDGGNCDGGGGTKAALL